MAPRKAPTSRGSANGDPSSTIASISGSTSAMENGNPSGGDMSAQIGERTGDDQQISQILAEMAQQNTMGSASRSNRGARPSNGAFADHASASPAPPADPTLGLPGVANVSPSLGAAATLSGSSNLHQRATPQPHARVESLPQQQQQGGNSLGEQDELDNSGGDGDAATPASSSKGKERKGDKRARGNGNEHKGMTEEEWERSRKANHKEVERRRRETINAGLDRLAALLPPVPTPPEGPPTGARAAKPNKSEILNRGIDYIQDLKQTHQADANRWTLEKLLKDQEIKKVQSEIDRLKEQNEVLKRKIEELVGGSAGGGTDEGGASNKKRRLEEEAP